jgi:hypothetical protein
MTQTLQAPHARPAGLLSSAGRLALLGAIRTYQYTLSAAFGPCCRFHPSCSHYGYEAVARFGALRGGWLAAKRIARCHPWNEGGEDPVPETWPAMKNTTSLKRRERHSPHDAARPAAGSRPITVERIGS